MSEELKLIVELFSKATDGALYAYVGYLGYSLAKTALIVLPCVSAVKFIVNKVFVSENS